MRHSNLAVCWTKATATCAVLLTVVQAFAVGNAISTYFISITPPQPVTNSQSITFEFASNYSDSRFVCALNDDDPTFCTSPKTYNNLRDGHYRFRVYAISATGGTDAVGVSHNWRVDTLPPNTWMAATPTGHASIVFALTSSEPNSTFLCVVDNDPAQPCATPVTIGGLPAGWHTFSAYAVDEATNVDPFGTHYKFEFANQPVIETTIISTNPTAIYTSQNNMKIEFVSNHSNANFECSLNGSPLASCASAQVYQNLADGNYLFKVHALDQFGTKDPTGDSHAWTVDTVPAVGSNIRTNPTSTSITITWTTNEPATTRLFWGISPNITREVADDGVMKTQHSVRLTGLSSNTVYAIEPAGQDRAANPHKMPRLTVRTLR